MVAPEIELGTSEARNTDHWTTEAVIRHKRAAEFCLTTCCGLVSYSAHIPPSRYVPPKRRFMYGLHGSIFQMITFITTAVRASNLEIAINYIFYI
jgi:hypothetical protein